MLNKSVSSTKQGLKEFLDELLPAGWTFELALAPAAGVDALFVASDPEGRRYPLFVELKDSVVPAEVSSLVAGYAGQKAVVAASAISPKSREGLTEAGWSWIDLGTREAVLTVGGLSVSKLAPPAKRQWGDYSGVAVRKLFKGASSRVVRWMLIEPERKWTVAEMGQMTGVSPSFVSRVFASLDAQGWVERRAGRYGFTRVIDPKGMLEAWAAAPSPVVEVGQRVSLESSPRKIAESLAMTNGNERYALTNEAGAEFVSPFARYSVVDVYVDRFDVWDTALRLTPVAQGGNVRLLRAHDDGVFDGARPRRPGEPSVVCLPQLYVDLARAGGPAQDAATFLLDQEDLWRP